MSTSILVSLLAGNPLDRSHNVGRLTYESPDDADVPSTQREHAPGGLAEICAGGPLDMRLYEQDTLQSNYAQIQFQANPSPTESAAKLARCIKLLPQAGQQGTQTRRGHSGWAGGD